MKFSNRWKAILAAIAGAGAITGGVLSRGGSKPAPAPIPDPRSSTYTLTVHVYKGDPAGDHKIVGAVIDSGELHATTDGAGNINLDGLPVGQREVCASAEGYSRECKTVTIPSGHLSLSLTPVAPPFVALSPLSTDGQIFRQGGQPWRWKGVTAFQLLDRFAHGEDISGFLADFKGFNILRVFLYTPPKDWGAKAWDVPSPDRVVAFLKRVELDGFYVELVLLTDDDSTRFTSVRALVVTLKAARPPNLLLEIGNEPRTHKDINTGALKSTLDASGFLYSSGDYEDSRRWFGQWIGFHSGRDGEWPRRAHDALDYYHGGGPNFPEEPALKVPAVCDEPIRPDQAGFNEADFRAYFGTCSLLGAGGTFHFESGKYGQRPTADEKRIAAVVLEALNHFPADAPKGAYSRPDEGGATLRTYKVGPYTVRIRPTDGRVFP